MSAPCRVTLAEVSTLPNNVDADLIWLCMSLVAARHALDAMFFRASDLWSGYEDIGDIESQMAALRLEIRQLSAEISETPAHTMAGMQARGAAIRAVLVLHFGIDNALAVRRHAGVARRSG